jgi:Pyruvate/2-oxoacid:ferredoxin oxidoreductase gamma subunit
MDSITGYDITTRIINRVIAEQNKYVTITRSAPPEIKGGVTVYSNKKRERIPLHKELLISLEKCRDYVNKKYLNVELTSNQVEDIFRYLCSDFNWRIFINNKKESEILNKVIVDVIIPIEEMTDSKGVYDKIIKEMENQCLFPKLRFRST